MIHGLVDANVLISYLLTDDPNNTVVLAMLTVLSEMCRVIVPIELLREVASARQNKRYLTQHIAARRMDSLFNLLDAYGYSPAPLPTGLGSFSRDPKDDYLLAYALVERADYLVTGDKDLLVLGQVGRMAIVTPAQFLAQISKR